MNDADLRALLQAANPAPGAPSPVCSPADERLLARILATPRRPRHAWIVRMLVPAVAVAAAACVAIAVLAHGTKAPSDEVEAPPGSASSLTVPPGGIVHVVTQHLSLMHGKVVPDGRMEGWAQPSTGRARFVGRNQNGHVFLEFVVDGRDRVAQWLAALLPGGTPVGNGGSPPLTVRHSAALARSQRRLVTDRIDELAREDYVGLMPDSAVRRFHRQSRTRYAGHAAIVQEDVVVRKILTNIPKGTEVPQGFFVRTYRDARTGAPLGYERGQCRPDGSHPRVITGERIVTLEALTGAAAVAHLAWQPVPGVPRSPLR